ncbi:undecaprenyl-diphosphate phosphatase [Truepera radiovictrix]|uniref:Undecaprenyl-diphosphatase n=1 Tax=Truepera radiovictrix (strain DSM 17093 / CIP 108686 / LMG 22925 / RQ-24) TaxID=649638 RepID=D7CRL2_TRURR|nr:undecaprenyl-diphosphate phosphatase [Truepera radiovictrix]ADI13502.1 Bacitracin resistance protein BacA [Truepera radiovictrix DSM 17093]WMT57936.1 undecaprenyl-diphosphate phosphatase [Truepera radiovictrix]
MTFFEAILLGIIQGVTEFLPISSSGHLVVIRDWFGITEAALSFDAVIHLGSLLAVMVAFHSELRAIVRGLTGARDDEAKEGRKLLRYLVLATLPLVVAALFFRDTVALAFESTLFTALMLYFTGALLLYAEKRPPPRIELVPSRRHVLAMGFAQILALLPGLSRSGMTIGAGMLAGLSRVQAARFSFLMSIPAILGASLFELTHVARASAGPGGLPGEELAQTISTGALITGTVTSLIASYLSIVVLLRFLKSGRLVGFAIYTWVLATLLLVLEVF